MMFSSNYRGSVQFESGDLATIKEKVICSLSERLALYKIVNARLTVSKNATRCGFSGRLERLLGVDFRCLGKVY